MREQGLERLQAISLKKNQPDSIVMHYLIRDLQRVVSDHASGNLLDVGCGNKPYEQLFTGKIASYTGCDVVQSSLNKVDVLCEATNLLFTDGSFDTVFSTQVIEHVSEPFKMIEEISRVLKRNGKLILSAPFCWELHEEPYDFFRYSKYGLQSMLENHGFDVIELKANGGKWAAIFQMNLNIIYSSFKRKGVLNKILKGLFTKLWLTSLSNKLALWMDKKYHSDLLTLNYVVVARKK